MNHCPIPIFTFPSMWDFCLFCWLRHLLSHSMRVVAMWPFWASSITPGLAIQFGSSTFFHGASKSSSSAVPISFPFCCEITFSLFSVMMILFFSFVLSRTSFSLPRGLSVLVRQVKKEMKTKCLEERVVGGGGKRNSWIGSLLPPPLPPRVVCLPTSAALAAIWFSLREGKHAGCVLHGKWMEGREGKGREGKGRGEGGGEVGGFVDGEVRGAWHVGRITGTSWHRPNLGIPGVVYFL